MPVASAQPSKLIQPLPLFAFILAIIAGLATLGLLFFYSGKDWAAGAQTSAIVAIVIGVLILIAFGTRAALGMLAAANPHRIAQTASALILAVLLFAFAGINLSAQSNIHQWQAGVLEGQKNWSFSMSEYIASGANASSSEDVARVNNLWGEELLSQQKFSDALAKFNTVLSTSTTIGKALATKNKIDTYQKWAAFYSGQKDYANATSTLDTLLGDPVCTADCQTSTSTLDATAYYNLAEQALAKPDYTAAVAAFQHLTTTFASSTSASKAHNDYAKALWGSVQNADLTASTCSSSTLPVYQQLSTTFSDTTEGQSAKTALTGNVTVKGTFTTTIPAASHDPYVLLTTTDPATITTIAAFETVYTSNPHTTVNSDGTFTLTGVVPGTSYYVIFGTLINTDNSVYTDYLVSKFTFAQLCTDTTSLAGIPDLIRSN
jgi:tetratricopeptide (TPR) repeat protein